MTTWLDSTAWQPAVVDHYDRALWDELGMHVRERDGEALPFDVRRWLRTPDAADETVLARCHGPTLDIGCGPGRLVAALAVRGIPALGVDVAPAAIALTRSRGGLALRRSVFERMPGAGRWHCAVVADGNIGIGGDVGGLLTRIRELLAPGGRALIEVEPTDTDRRLEVEVTAPDGRAVGAFPWARIGAPALRRVALDCGFRQRSGWHCDGRHFVELRAHGGDVRER
ncbi:MAG TPA: class I SAM-dependent methyltransferase [Sporichthyaceae bacterium]